MNNKKTLVLGASPNPERVSNEAVLRLKRNEVPLALVGIREGEIDGEKILTGTPAIDDVHTVTLYIGAKNQPQYYDYIVGLKPKRIIFNPGTENPEFFTIASEKGIETLNACTLVMLAVGNY
ncbi:MAG: CoA-binding protein [Flavobacteriales bacterium]|nr:MAG: CoA-binding protein [Flavobacteriales bacterium]